MPSHELVIVAVQQLADEEKSGLSVSQNARSWRRKSLSGQ